MQPRELFGNLPLGVADCVTELSTGIVVFLFNRRILQVIGEGALVSYTVISYVATLVLMTMSGLSQGMLPLVSYQYGKGEEGNVRALLRIGLKAALVCSLAWFVICQAAAGGVTSLFISREAEPVLFAQTIRAFRIYSAAFLFMGGNVLFSTWLSATERPGLAISISMARGLVAIAVCLIALPYFLGEVGIWASAGVSELLCLGFSFLLYQLAVKTPEEEAEPAYVD